MNIFATLILYNPIFIGVVMTLTSLSIFNFWYHIMPYKRHILPAFRLIVALFNGIMSMMAEMFTANNASPRTIAIYMPIMIIIELFFFGKFNKWGTLFVFVITSFQFITMFSVAIGIVNLLAPPSVIDSRYGLVMPVTMMQISLFILLTSLNIYRKLLPQTRDVEINDIISSPKSSLALLLYMSINSFAVMMLSYRAIDALYDTASADMHISTICLNMIVRDLILFFSSILILDIQSRTLQATNRAKALHEKNKDLTSDIEHEKQLREVLHRNILLRFTVNISSGIVTESGALNILHYNKDAKTTYDEILEYFSSFIVYSEDKEALLTTMDREHILSIVDTEKGFNISARLSPKRFINHLALDDNAAKLHAYIGKEYIWVNIDCSLSKNSENEVLAYFYVLDVDAQRQQEENIKLAASTDSLTGLLNRNAFGHALSGFMNKDGASGTLFMFDLDYFKEVNDNLGHPKGDELLKDVAKLLKNTFRSDDLVCRIGGDEFFVFAKGLTDMEFIAQRAASLNASGRRTFKTDNDKTIRVSFSIGISVIPDFASDTDTLYKQADEALYAAKENGRDCYKIFEESLPTETEIS